MNAIQIVGLIVCGYGAAHALTNLIRAHRIYEAHFARLPDPDDVIARQLANCEAPAPTGFRGFHSTGDTQ